ncbi:MAG: DUF3592 domain-containing protein [Patescibacteria group bacterium]
MKDKKNNSVGTTKIKYSLIGGILFFIIGVFMLIFFSWLTYTVFVQQIKLVYHSSSSQGTIVSISRERGTGKNRNVYSYFPVVEYSDKLGVVKTFKNSLASDPASYEIGQKINILVPNDDDSPEIDSFMDRWFGVIIVSIFDLISLSIVFFCIYIVRRSNNFNKLLRRNGEVVKAKVILIDEGSTDTPPSWYIKAEWQNPRNNKVYTFESDDIAHNPEHLMGKMIDVTILPKDPRIYEIDISKLLQAQN